MMSSHLHSWGRPVACDNILLVGWCRSAPARREREAQAIAVQQGSCQHLHRRVSIAFNRARPPALWFGTSIWFWRFSRGHHAPPTGRWVGCSDLGENNSAEGDAVGDGSTGEASLFHRLRRMHPRVVRSMCVQASLPGGGSGPRRGRWDVWRTYRACRAPPCI